MLLNRWKNIDKKYFFEHKTFWVIFFIPRFWTFFFKFFSHKIFKKIIIWKNPKIDISIFFQKNRNVDFWIFSDDDFLKILCEKFLNKKVQNRVMKNATQNVLCSKKYFFINIFSWDQKQKLRLPISFKKRYCSSPTDKISQSYPQKTVGGESNY